MNIKFITVNIWIGGKLIPNLIEFLKKEQPDIVTMQEVYNGSFKEAEERYRSIEVLKDTLGFEHLAFTADFNDEFETFNADRGNAIFSKYPLTPQSTIFYDQSYKKYHDIENSGVDWAQIPRSLQHVLATVENTSLHIFNTHGIWGVDGLDNESRLHMSNVILEQVKNKENVILAGDFNTKPDTQTMQQIGNVLTNVFDNELTTSFNMTQKKNPGFADAVVDMIFVSKDIQVVDHYCPTVNVSDHLPLVMTVNI